jgi:hypothetical protein
MRFVSFLLHKSLDKVNFYTGLIVPFKIKTTGTTVGPCFVSFNEEITSTSTKTLLFFRTMTWTLITHTPESYSKHYISSTFPPFSTQECIFLRKSLSRQRLESLIAWRCFMLHVQQNKNSFIHFEMPWEFVGKSTNYTKVRVIHHLYTTLHKTILGFADIGSMEPTNSQGISKWMNEFLFCCTCSIKHRHAR